MSDIEISGSDSEPISDVNPEEMARLIADLDDMDNDLFKSTLKSTEAKKDDDNSKRQVKFDEKPASASKVKAKAPTDDDDEDWDADDLLQSDDETHKKKPTQKVPPSTHTSSSPVKAENPSKNSESNEGASTKSKAKSKLMADLFSDESSNANKDPGKNLSSPGEGSVRDKNKLMADLFGSNDVPGDSNTKKSPIKKNAPAGKKAKEDITFDDDDDLLGGIGDSKAKSAAVTNSPMSGGFLDSLLAKSSTVERVKTKDKSPEFVLDDKYKNMNKEKNEGKGFGGFVPSSGKSKSPHQRTPKKTGSDDPFDFLSNTEPRRRNPRSGAQRKTFEIDDDDILGNVRSRGGRNQEQGKESKQSVETPTKGEVVASAKLKNDSWLFGSPSSADKTLKETIHETSVQASVERENVSKAQSPNKSQDWLGDLLLSSKKSPQKYQQGSPVGGLPNFQPSGPSQQVTPSTTSTKKPNSDLPTGVDDASNTSNAAFDIHHVPALKAAEDTQREFLKNQQMAEAQAAAAVEQMKIQQEQIMQQQEAKLKAAAIAASQMKLQQEQLEAQLSQQLLHQQQEMAKFQDTATRRYQDMMVASVSQLNIGNSSSEKSSQDEKIKELEIQLRSLEIEVARLEAELELLRKQHSQEITILEESHRKKHQMERDVWECTEQRLKEERNSLASDFQAKVSSLQAEKESLGASYEAQLANVKREWSQAFDQTKELYSEMTERMKAEHSAALERMTYLKDLELNAVVSASGHVKEVEVVMLQLESNTANLSNLTASINTRHDSALELTQKALKLKEKQLKDFEAELEASHAEAESERGRLNALINRLENTLIQQGSEVEKERWKLAKEQMKIEIERKALNEERQHLQMSVEADRQNLTSIRESLLAEHQVLLQSVARDKQELASQRVQLSAQQKVPHMSLFGNQFSSRNISQFELEAELAVINDERRRFKEKMASVIHQEQQLKEEKQNLEELKSKLERTKAQVSLENNLSLQEKVSLRKMQEEVKKAEEASEAMRKEQQSRLSQITAQTQALHVQQEKIQKEQLKLERQKEEINRLVQMGRCPSCQNRGITGYTIESSDQHTFGRLPGDGGEGHAASKAENFNMTSMSPASVLARLAAARERENLEREKRLLQISALELS